MLRRRRAVREWTLRPRGRGGGGAGAGRSPAGTVTSVASTWTRPRAIAAHVTLALSEPGFAALTVWQVHRALGGNKLSWMYVFEWPFFGGYAVYVWWRIVHDEEPARHGRAASETPLAVAAGAVAGSAGSAGAVGAAAARRDVTQLGGRSPGGASPAPDESPDESPDEERELAAYNRYLAALRAEDRPKRW
jgi:hypothetical protein